MYKALLFLILSLCSCTLTAQESSETIKDRKESSIYAKHDSIEIFEATTFQQDLKPSLLWKISHDSLTTTSYLYGTMHLPDSRVIELFDSIGNKIEHCEAVAVELVLNASDAFAMMPQMVMKDSTLRDFYTPQEFERVNSVAKEELGLLGMFSNKMKPIFISSTIQQMRFGGDIKYVVDQYVQDEAKRLNKELIGIETMEEQMSALTGMSLQQQADMLLEYIDDLEKNDSLTNVLVNTYLDQSLSGLYDIYKEDELPEEMNDDLVLIRNIKMAKRIEKLIWKQSTFVAVGALHLPGETGLINMLREAGFKVEAAQR